MYLDKLENEIVKMYKKKWKKIEEDKNLISRK